jgi:DNA-binding GntR family transcriptional regulator
MRTPSADAYALLRRRIILGEFQPGAPLREEALARELGISRSPIRAAFQRLQADGLVIMQRYRGVVVAPWTDQDNDEVFDLRALVESHAAALAAERRRPEHLREMEALNQRMAWLITHQPDDFLVELQQINRQFHQEILKAAASPRLNAFVHNLMAVHRVIGAFFYYTDAQLNESLQDHLLLTRTISQGNSQLACALMDSHIRGTAVRLRTQRQAVRNPGTHLENL